MPYLQQVPATPEPTLNCCTANSHQAHAKEYCSNSAFVACYELPGGWTFKIQMRSVMVELPSTGLQGMH